MGLTRCTATTRYGTQCWNSPSHGEAVCSTHVRGASGRSYEAAMCVLLHWKEHHTPATVRAVAKRMGLTVSTAGVHLRAAAVAGLIEQHADRSYWPKEACVCPTCGAAHVSERDSA